MSLEENKAIVRRLAEAINERDLTLLDDLMAPDFVDHDLQLRGLESFKKYEATFIKGFPDIHLTIKDIITKGDKVWIRIEGTGTHTGEFRGLAPTGKKCKIIVVHIYRIFNGKVVENWNVDDFLDCYKQLGVIEYKGFPDEDVS